MQARYKWLLLPPAIAVVLFMGPLRDTEPSPADNPPVQEAEDPVGQSLVPMPDAWQVGSSLLGILLLGVAGVMLLARLRRGPSARAGDLMNLRQSLRLSPRHRLHAVQFDDNILLVGESEGRITLLRQGRDPERFEDEAELAARHEDEGAVPRDMVIPRPASPMRKKATPPALGRDRTKPSLDDFRDLLRSVKAGAKR